MNEEAALHRSEVVISTILRAGVGASAVMMIAGFLIAFLHHPEYRHAPGELHLLTSPDRHYPSQLFPAIRSSMQGHGEALATLGILLLIATPVLRVAASIVLFLQQRDRLYAVITVTVLLLLLLSFGLGRASG